MMRPYLMTFTGTASWAALSATRIPFKGSLGALTSNGGNLQIRVGSDAATEQTFVPGEFWPIDKCDISTIQIKGNGYVLKAVGVTDEGW